MRASARSSSIPPRRPSRGFPLQRAARQVLCWASGSARPPPAREEEAWHQSAAAAMKQAALLRGLGAVLGRLGGGERAGTLLGRSWGEGVHITNVVATLRPDQRRPRRQHLRVAAISLSSGSYSAQEAWLRQGGQACSPSAAVPVLSCCTARACSCGRAAGASSSSSCSGAAALAQAEFRRGLLVPSG